MVQGATLGRMTEPQRVGTSVLPPSVRERLAHTRPGFVVPEDSHRESDEDRRARMSLQATNAAIRWRSRLPAMFRDASTDDLDDDQHAVDVAAWLLSGRTGLLLAGTVGAGKTHAAYAVGNAALAQGLTVEAWTMHDLLSALRPDGDPAALAFARAADVLILDDLMAAKVTPWMQETMTSLMDARLRDERRTVVTTNATAAALAESWGARTVDRMTYRAQVLVFTGESRRGTSW